MPDISMCANPEKCPKAHTCHRATAKPAPLRQAYAEFFKQGEECEYYWPVNERVAQDKGE